MPPREHPTVRQARLGAELRKLRERAGRTAREAAEMLGTDQGKISHIESGRIGVSEERVRRLAAFYACADEALLSALCAIARERRGQHWWDEYRSILAPRFLDIAEMEHHAVSLRTVQTVTMPGLLQTEAYARALFSSADDLSSAEVDARTEHRMRRQGILDREEPPLLEATIHEAALRMRFGGRQVARKQLEHLMTASERAHITVRVVPFTNEQFYEMTQAVIYADGVVPQLDTVQVDGPIGGRYIDNDEQIAGYRDFLAKTGSVSLDENESRQLIHHIAREM
ncbi:helix-turn-helix domain-containing protein [Streptomyces sp. 4N509B]|uniref:helix-turn-helix domain-containing protein n=1 Tax=Streptomyces sp. 4N509B TaxID=3457413 RepID=UPI003FD4FDEF